MTDRKPPRPGSPLSPAELAVLRLIANGHTSAGVAAHLHITTNTIRTHLERIRHKLGAEDQAHSVALAIATRQLHPREITITAPVRSAV